MKNLFLLSFSIFICPLLSAQTAPEIEWQNTIGGTVYEVLNCISQIEDGGYMLGGYSDSGISGDKIEASNGGNDYWIVKLDDNGNIVWQNTIGGSDDDDLYGASPTEDGGYIVAGHSFSGISGDKTEANISTTDYNDLWIVKLDEDGNILWQNTIGGNLFDFLGDIKETPNGGFIIGAYSKSAISGDKTENKVGNYDYWIIKLDDTGNIEWQNVIGGEDYDELRAIELTDDGGYIAGGVSGSGISGDKTELNIGKWDYWIVKLNDAGAIEWQNTIGGSLNDDLTSIEQTIDGGYIIGGYSISNISGDKTENKIGEEDYWIVKLNSTGDIEWQNTIGGNKKDVLLETHQTVDGGYILCGNSYSGISGDKTEGNLGEVISTDYWIIKLNPDGTISWQNTIGGSGTDALRSGSETSDSGFILGGYSSSGISGDKTEAPVGSYDYWVIKLYPEEIECLVTSTITPSGSTTFCNGDNVILNATTGTGYTYKWYKNGILVPPATSASMIITKAGNYKVEISNGTCSDISDEITIIVNPKPNATINNVDVTNNLCVDASIKLKTNSGAGFSYQWYKGVVAIAGATSNIYFATTIGNYKVKVTNSFGCEKVSAAYAIINSCKLSDENNLSFDIYPNPNSGEFTLHISELIDEEIIYINIKNMLGEEIYSDQLNTSELTHQINLEKNIAEGMYVVEITPIAIGTADKIYPDSYREQIIILR